jgi:hypothetical protein
LRHLRKLAKTEREKQLTKEIAKGIEVIPEGCRLPMKARIIRAFVKKIYLK